MMSQGKLIEKKSFAHFLHNEINHKKWSNKRRNKNAEHKSKYFKNIDSQITLKSYDAAYQFAS